jgi:hypothetical protein
MKPNEVKNGATVMVNIGLDYANREQWVKGMVLSVRPNSILVSVRYTDLKEEYPHSLTVSASSLAPIK